MKQRAKIAIVEDLGTCLRGYVYGHPRIAEGHHVWTSAIVRRDLEKQEIETENTIYTILD